MAIDPQVQRLLEIIEAVTPENPPPRTPQGARAAYAALLAQPPSDAGIASTEALSVPGPAGDVRVRVYRPEPSSPSATVVYFHGGGWVIGSVDTHDPQARALCSQTGSVVVSVDYRLAPEHPFPAALDDCTAATLWAIEHASELGGVAANVAVAGPSAGANLATAVALRLRDAGGPELAAQLLIYPVTDASQATPSYRENAKGFLLEADTMRWFWDCYLGGRAPSPESSILDAEDLSGLPPSVVVTAGFDPLRDEGRAFAERLTEAGVPVVLLEYPSLIHEFAGLTAHIEAGATAMAEVLSAFRKLLSP